MYIDPTRSHNLEEELTVTIFLKSFLNNFPVALLGKELTNVTRLIFLYGETYNQGEKKMFILTNKILIILSIQILCYKDYYSSENLKAPVLRQNLLSLLLQGSFEAVLPQKLLGPDQLLHQGICQFIV